MFSMQWIYLICIVSVLVSMLPAQEVQPSPTPEEVEPMTSGFILFTMLQKPAALKCVIGTNNVVLDASGEPVGSGFTSSLIPWRPAKATLRAEAPGFRGAELRPFLEMGETPVIVLQERSTGSLSFSVIRNTENRGAAFYDAINLSAQPSLTITANGKKMRLPKGERVRIGSEKNVKFSVDGGPSDVLESMDDPSHLVLFFSEPTGKIGFSVVPDMPLQ